MTRFIQLAIATLASTLVAVAEARQTGIDREFELPAEDVSNAIGAGGVDLGRVDFGGNPAKGALSWWPEDLRGYPSGRCRDRMMYTPQCESRRTVNDRWIMTGFGGFGEVAGDFSDFGRDFLPAAGVGFRFVHFPKHRISLSLAVAAGKNGTEFCFGVGAAS